MANAKTDFSISALVNPDTSRVQKILRQQNFIINADIRTRDAEQSIQRLNTVLQNTGRWNLDGFERINTQIQTGLSGVDNFGNRLTNLTRYIETFKNSIGDMEQRVTVMTENGIRLETTQTRIANGIQEITTDTRQFNETLNGLNTTVTQVTKTTTDTAGNTRRVVETTREWTDAAGRLNTEITTTNELGEQLAPTTRTISDNIRQTGDTAQQTANQVNGLGRSFSNAIATLTRYYLASLPIRTVQTIISETVETLRDFDNALIEFRKVSDLAGEGLTTYITKLTEMGEITGSTMQAMVEASTQFRKSGFSDEDSATLASVAEMYRNVADEEISAADSASFIIAQMKAFNIEAEDAMHIIDAVNEVSNHFAVSSADLATNIGKVSASLAVNGVEYEEVLGMMTAITEVTRNASTASRGLNMISSRLVQVLDDSSSTGKKLTEIYDDLGIALKDDEGQMRSTYDILKDLAKVWNSLSGDQQKYIALTSAGARQTQNFVALMKNFNTAIEATAMAYDSAGSAARENERVMDSISKKVEILRSEFQQLVLGEGGLQNFAKTVLDIGIALLKFANSDVGQVINGTALLLASFALINTVVNLMTTTAIPHLIESMVVLATKLIASSITSNTTALSLMGLTEAEAIAAAETMTLGEAFEMLTVAMLTNPAVLIIAGLTAAVVSLIVVTKNLNAELSESTKRLEEYSQSYRDAKQNVENLETSLKDIEEQIKKIENKKINITNPSELAQLEKESAELKEQEETIKRKLALAKQELEVARQQAEIEAKKNINAKTPSQFQRAYGSGGQIRVTAQEELDLAIEKHKELTETIENLRKEQEEYANSGENNAKKVEEYKNKIGELEEQLAEVDARGVEMANTLQQDADALTSTDESTQQLKSSVEASIDAWQEATGYEEEAKEQIEETNEEMEDQEDEIDELDKELEKLIQSLGMTETEFRGLEKAFGGNKEVLVSYLQGLAEARQKLADTSTVIDNLQDALTTASDALEEYNKNGYLTIDTFQSLMGISAQYLAALVNENGQLEINQTTLGNLVEQLKIAKIEELQEAAAMEIAANHTQSASTASANAVGNVANIGNTIQTTGNQAATAAGKVATFADEVSRLSGVKLGDMTAQDKKIINTYKDIAKEIANITVNTTKAGNAASSAGKKGAGAAKSAKDATKDLNKELEETKKKYDTIIKWISKQYDKEIDKIKKAKDEVVKAEEAKIKAKEKEKDAALDAIEKEIRALEREKNILKEQKEALDEKKQALKNEENEIVKSIEKRIKALEKERDALIKPVEERIKVLEKERDTILDSTQKEIDALTELKEQRTAYWDEQINALKEANKELKDNLELQEKLDALEKAKNTKVKIYKEGQGFVYDVDQNAVQKAQKELDEYLSQKAYEDELARLENLKKAEIDSYDQRLNELKKYKENVKKLYDEQINDLKKYKEETQENYNEQIEALKEFKETVQEEYEEQIEIINQDIEALEKHMDELDKHKDALEEHKDAIEENFEKEIEELERHKDAVEEAYDAEIATWEKYKQEFEDMVNAYEEQQNRLLFEQLTGIKDESNNWMTRLDNLAEFVRKYNEIQKQLDTGNTDVANDASMSQGSAPSSSSSSTGSKSSKRTVTNKNTSTNKSGGDAQYTPSYTTPVKTSGRAIGNINLSSHASGVSSIADNEIAIVGDSPNQELVIGSKLNGSLMSLGKGAGVVNANSATTLAGMLNQIGKYGASGFGSGGGTLNNNYNNDSLTINGVTIQGANITNPETFVNSLLNLKAEALQRAYSHR